MSEAEDLKLLVKGWEKMPFELPLYERFLICCNRTVESELFVSFLKTWMDDGLLLVAP